MVFAFILAPGIWAKHWGVALSWAAMMAVSLLLWMQNCLADPGWLTPRTIFPQHKMIGEDPTISFDAEQPVESQMVHYDSIAEQLVADRGSSASATALRRLELEQNKFNYQRQLIT